MKLLSEVRVRVKRGYLPHFTNELYKWNCEVRRIEIMESGEGVDHFLIEVVYYELDKFSGFLDKIGKHLENFRIESVRNALEDEIFGGLLSVTGKMQIENAMDYEMRLLGATELIFNKVENDPGARSFTGISRNVAMICGVRKKSDISQKNLLRLYTEAERDSIVVNRFAGYNGYPLLVRFEHIADFIRVLQRVEESFSALRILDIEEEYDPDRFEEIYEGLGVPLISRSYDEIPLLLATILFSVTRRNKLGFENVSVGMIGIDVSSQRTVRLLKLLGCSKVLGYDDNETLMLGFENEGGLSTTQENIFNNSDIIILSKKDFSGDDLDRIIPGQIIISLINNEDLNEETMSSRGVKEFIDGYALDLSSLIPGLVKGLISSKQTRLDDACLIKLAKDISNSGHRTLLPPLFSDIHERLPVFIREYADMPS